MILVLQGNNPDLGEETATTWTVGLDFASQGYSLSLTYFDIDYKDRIVQPGPLSPFEILFQEDQWAEVIARNPSPSQIAAVCNRSDFFGSVSDCLASSPAAIIDFRLRNLSSIRTRGIDIQLDKLLRTEYGDFLFGLNSAYVFDFRQALAKSSPAINIVNTAGNPLTLKLRSRIQWDQRGQSLPGFFANVAVNYNGRYRDTVSALHRVVDAWVPIDLQVGYRTAASDGWLGHIEFRLNAVNVFDSGPPFVDRNFGYDILNAVPYGRVMSLFVEKSW